MEKPGTFIRRTGTNTKICGTRGAFRWNSMLCKKEKCGNDGNAKCRDALLPFICAHAFDNVEAKLLGSQWLWKREERRDPHSWGSQVQGCCAHGQEKVSSAFVAIFELSYRVRSLMVPGWLLRGFQLPKHVCELCFFKSIWWCSFPITYSSKSQKINHVHFFVKMFCHAYTTT